MEGPVKASQIKPESALDEDAQAKAEVSRKARSARVRMQALSKVAPGASVSPGLSSKLDASLARGDDRMRAFREEREARQRAKREGKS